MPINAISWLDVARERNPKLPFTTDWFDGTVAPVRVGWYVRFFTDSLTHQSPAGDGWSMQYWDGKYWRANPTSEAHWRQVGDYPAWRGLTQEQHDMQTAGGVK